MKRKKWFGLFILSFSILALSACQDKEPTTLDNANAAYEQSNFPKAYTLYKQAIKEKDEQASSDFELAKREIYNYYSEEFLEASNNFELEKALENVNILYDIYKEDEEISESLKLSISEVETRIAKQKALNTYTKKITESFKLNIQVYNQFNTTLDSFQLGLTNYTDAFNAISSVLPVSDKVKTLADELSFGLSPELSDIHSKWVGNVSEQHQSLVTIAGLIKNDTLFTSEYLSGNDPNPMYLVKSSQANYLQTLQDYADENLIKLNVSFNVVED